MSKGSGGLPVWQGASADQVATQKATNTANDIWGLGDLYGQPIYLGEQPLSQRPALSEYGVQPMETPPHAAYGNTQDIMDNAMKLWSQQVEDRQRHPDRLTPFERLQQQLWYAGFYGQTPLDSVHVGQWTDQTQSALQGALANYEEARKSGVPVTFAEFLAQNEQTAQSGVGGENSSAGNGGAGGSGGGSKSTAPLVLTDPTELRAAAQSAATAALGRGLSDKQLDLFVQQFQAQQMSNATQQGGTVDSQDVATQAMQFAQQENPGDYQAHNAQGYMNALVNLLSGAGSRPDITPVPEA